ncbi:MAG: DUF547 domain-containing protein [Gemmatimonadales bacterium]|nr:DUF547 domain-containing protein [Gemmatimonadales bacterium]
MWHQLAVAAALATDPRPQPAFDHAEFDRLLRTHVVDGMVDYDAFAADPGFDRYLGHLAAADPSGWARDEQLAFWLNAYNAYTIRLIVKHRERGSIRNINRALGLFKGLGPWAEKLVVVGGTTYDLETVEQQIIRPTFREPRIHFALVCAAMGCPPLRSEAYRGADLERQLEDQSRIFLTQSPDKNRVDLARRSVWVSEVFKFNDYAKDFGGSDATIMRFIARYYPPGPERDLLESGSAKLTYTKYDWTLNSQEQARKRPASVGRGRS